MRKRPIIGTNLVTFGVFCACILCAILGLWAVRSEHNDLQPSGESSLKSIIDEWEEFWPLEEPTPPPYRQHGGVI